MEIQNLSMQFKRELPSPPSGEVCALTIQRHDNGETLSFTGRSAWALGKLLGAGEKGCTPITHPGPRWSHYTWLLRRAGLDVATVTESHGGPFAGHHARYVLRTPVAIIEAEAAR